VVPDEGDQTGQGRPIGNGGQTDHVIYFEGYRPGGAESDALTARRLVWNEANQELTERPLATLPAVITEEFPDPEAARQASWGGCVEEYWVLPADRFGGAPSEFVLAFVAAQPETVESEMARPCEAGLARRMAQFHAPAP
jgi:hypothetical protein